MITEKETQATAEVQYEYLQVRATVVNNTDQDMRVTGSDLSWGKWMRSPVDVPRRATSLFGSQGRDSSPSGTEGWVEWTIGGAVVRVTFSCPYKGSNAQTIECSPSGRFKVSCTGTGGDVNNVQYRIDPAL